MDWRVRCRENAAKRRAIAAKLTPRPGQIILFETPVAFADGRSFDPLEVVASGRSRRIVLFRDPKRGGFYRIPNVKRREYRLVDQQRE